MIKPNRRRTMDEFRCFCLALIRWNIQLCVFHHQFYRSSNFCVFVFGPGTFSFRIRRNQIQVILHERNCFPHPFCIYLYCVIGIDVIPQQNTKWTTSLYDFLILNRMKWIRPTVVDFGIGLANKWIQNFPYAFIYLSKNILMYRLRHCLRTLSERFKHERNINTKHKPKYIYSIFHHVKHLPSRWNSR